MKTDLKLKQDILAELKYEPSIDENEIGVITRHGVVTLTGHVRNYGQKLAAEKAASRVKGVKAIVEEITINVPSSKKRTDAQIAEAVANTLKWNSTIPNEKLKIKVENGVVYLNGEVSSQYEKKAVRKVVSLLWGIKHVVNRISIKSPINTSEVKSKIKQALERSARIDANHISVNARNHEVILKGKVRSWAEKEDARIAASKAPGVWAVKNELTVVQ